MKTTKMEFFTLSWQPYMLHKAVSIHFQYILKLDFSSFGRDTVKIQLQCALKDDWNCIIYFYVTTAFDYFSRPKIINIENHFQGGGKTIS